MWPNDNAVNNQLLLVRLYMGRISEYRAAEVAFSAEYTAYKQEAERSFDTSVWNTSTELEHLCVEENLFLFRIALLNSQCFRDEIRVISRSQPGVAAMRERLYSQHYFNIHRHCPASLEAFQMLCQNLMTVFKQVPLDVIYSKLVQPCAEDNMLSAIRDDIFTIRQAKEVTFVSLYKTRHGRPAIPPQQAEVVCSKETVARAVIPPCLGCKLHFYYDLCYAIAPDNTRTKFEVCNLVTSCVEGSDESTHVREEISIQKP